MSEPRPFPFGSVPVYNPQSLSKGEALAQFHARQAAYQSLMNLLREERPSHVMIIGTRGMGKTTLLQRVRYGVEDDPALNSRYVVLVFPEEQYNVSRLHHFLLNTVDALADAMERLHNERMLKRVEGYAEKIGKVGQEEIEEQVPKFLAEVGREIGKNLLLLVDNGDRLFETIEKQEQWRLRELLSNRSDLTLFGATTQASDGIYGPHRAFFEFFKIYTLTPLSFEEVRDLLLQLSESVEEEEGEKDSARRRVEEWLDADPARVRTLVQLTGGNPRTTVLLFHLVLDGLAGGAREYLEQLLDQCTPNYKGRVDELPSQAQQVLDAVALRWDPVTAMDVAEDTGLETSAVSTQLTRLVRQGLLEKADPGDSKKALYQVAERFFNIWYLMRASRRVRAKLRWFVEFLRVFFESADLEAMAWERLQLFQRTRLTRSAELETTFAYVLASGADRNRFEDYLRRECAEREPEWRPYIELIHPSMLHLKGGSAGKVGMTAKFSGEVVTADAHQLRRATETDPANAGNWRNLGRVLSRKKEFAVEAETALRKAIELDPNSARAWDALGDLLGSIRGRVEEAEAAYRSAIELDPGFGMAWSDLGRLLWKMPKREEEAEAALRKAIEINPDSAAYWINLGNILATLPDRREAAETALRKGVELAPEAALSWDALGDLMGSVPERRVEAEAAYRKAIELDPNFGMAWSDLGKLLGAMRERGEEAEAALRKAVELNPKVDRHWINLGNFLAMIPDRKDEAEASLRKAIELDPEFALSWDSLGHLLANIPERTREAELALREAIKFHPNSFAHWANLGGFLTKHGRLEEAEAALRKAIEIDSNSDLVWMQLGNVLAEMVSRTGEAEAAFRKAIQLNPGSCEPWVNLGHLWRAIPDRGEDAEAAYRKAIELHRDSCQHWADLGMFLAADSRKSVNAEAALRKAIECHPDSGPHLWDLANFLARTSSRSDEAEAAFAKALEAEPTNAELWGAFGVFLACVARRPTEAEHALREAVERDPSGHQALRNLGVLLYCEIDEKEAVPYVRRTHDLRPSDPVTAAILAACVAGSEPSIVQGSIFMQASRKGSFWSELLGLCETYPPFGKILIKICDLVQERDSLNNFARVYRAVALAQLGEFPRAAVVLEDALTGDPIDELSAGKQALDVFLAAAVRNGRVQDCLELLDRKEWKDAWRPIYEALKAVEAGSGEYLKKVAVEIREPASTILRRIAPELPASNARAT